MRLKGKSPMDQRLEIVKLGLQPGANVREICRRYKVSPTMFYRWKERFEALGAEGLTNQSTKPKTCPHQTSKAVEEKVLEVRKQYEFYGARKVRAVLSNKGQTGLPSPSTVHAILKRHGLIVAPEHPNGATTRFEHEKPNDLWQMDFKGHFACGAGRAHPFTLLDDHSRYNLALRACHNETRETVQPILTEVFRRYGLPLRMTMDNGSPWGDEGSKSWTRLTVWLARLGVMPSHSRPYHPQTQGKDERFHRTLDIELLSRQSFKDLPHLQKDLDRWRDHYNHERPHEALGQKPPISRYTASPRTFPETLPPIDYAPDVFVRKVQKEGWVSWKNQNIRVSKAFTGLPIGFRPTLKDGVYDVLFSRILIGEVDLITKKVTPGKRRFI